MALSYTSDEFIMAAAAKAHESGVVDINNLDLRAELALYEATETELEREGKQVEDGEPSMFPAVRARINTLLDKRKASNPEDDEADETEAETAVLPRTTRVTIDEDAEQIPT
eukprot:gb/GEZN01016030.1/.p2 GENE.gb/GEZN01016030.1/~~gb/GEZN01016030.1/.p2  ORF type:complete len:112 (-),score=15.21 gb/GEZN01016030.1/:77-412(-)